MTIYYVDSTATGGSDTGGSWANAFLTFAQAVTAATTENDIIYVSHAHSESLSADTTYTFGANVRVLCVNSGTGALATTAVIGAQATSYSIASGGGYNIYVRGIIFRINGTGIKSISLMNTSSDGSSGYFEECRFDLLSTANNARIYIGQNTSNGYVELNSCTFKFGSVNQMIEHRTNTAYINCSVDSAGSAAYLFQQGAHGDIVATGCDFSHITSTLVLNNTSAGTNVVLSNCKFGSGVTIKAAASTVLNKGNVSVWAFNCDAGDNHYTLYHGDAFGETTVSNFVYANDGAKYDGSHGCSWRIITTANCSYYTPYVSPWIDVYYDDNYSITPYLEIIRRSSVQPFYNDEVWTEWSYQGTTDSTKSTIDNSDRMTPLGSRAAQTSSNKTAADWTGYTGLDWFGKLGPTSAITPVELGHIRARICVGLTSTTVYVDPIIRIS